MHKTNHKIGISSFTFPFACGVHPSQRPKEPFDPMDIVLKSKELGADCVQYGDNMPLENYSDDYLKSLGQRAAMLGITLEMGMREARPERILRYIAIAKLTGAKLIRCILDGVNGSYEPSVDEACDSIQKILPSLIENDIILGIENHDRLPADDYARIAGRIDDPHVGLVVDTTNSLSTEEPTIEVLEKMAPYCVCLHVKDYKIHRANSGMGLIIVGECPGKGRQDISLAFDTAKRLSKRDFNLILESWMEPCATLEESLKQENEWAQSGVKYLKAIVSK